ncbi:MAG: TraM recognition domain-containing protein [Chloroflexota bacterium]
MFKRRNPNAAKPPPRASPWEMDTPLLFLSSADSWTIRDACEGAQIMGGIGSGKTSGSGKAIAHSFLRAGMGGLVMCAKPEEKDLWLKYCHETGRESQVIVFNPLEKWRYNFIDAELNRSKHLGGGLTENIVELLTTVTSLCEGTKGMDSGDKFWDRSMRVLLRNAIEVISIAKDRITLEDICRFILEAPQSVEQVADEAWRNSSFTAECIAEADAKPKSRQEQHDCDISIRYWLASWPTLADRTRSSISATWESVGDILLHGAAYDLLSTSTNWLPEITFMQGAITILDLPIQRYHGVGRIIQGILKYAWQRAVLARNVEEHPRPVFLWADESQHFISQYDYEYQSTARSARACTVYLTQNISNYYSALGSGAHAQADALLGLMQTLVFHAQPDQATNEWASKRIGQHYTTQLNFGSSTNGTGPGSRSGGGSETIQYKILPAAFTTLRKGGPQNNLEVEAILFQGGRVWKASGETYLKTVFKQG